VTDIKVHFDRDELVGRLQSRLHSPLFGVVRSIGSHPAPRQGPRFFVDHVEVAGDPDGPPRAAGAGGLRSEARVRALGIAVERYADALAAQDDGPVPVTELLSGTAERIPAGVLADAPVAATASHIVPDKALLAALRRVIARNAGGPLRRIVPGERTRPLDRILARHLGAAAGAEFFLARSPGFTVLCRLTLPGGRRVIGRANHAVLPRAMHEALLDAACAGQDAYWQDGPSRDGRSQDASLGVDGAVAADGLPDDELTTAGEGIASILAASRGTGVRLVHRDLTTPDVRSVGFHVARVALL
jgi:hypothetical protein